MSSKRQLRSRSHIPASPNSASPKQTMEDMQALLDRQSERLALLSSNQHDQTTASLAALSVSISNIEKSVKDNTEQIMDLKRRNANLEMDLSVLKDEVATLKANTQPVCLTSQRVTGNDNHQTAEDARAVSVKDDLVAKLKSSAEVLIFTCSNGRMMNPKYIGSQTGRYCFREHSPQLCDMTAIVSSHTSTPKVVVISCLTNDVDLLSSDPMSVANKIEKMQQRLREQVSAVNSKWHDAEVVIEMPPPILSAGENRDIRSDTLWLKDVEVELDLAHGQPRKTTASFTDWISMKMPLNGHLFWPESVMRDEKHVGVEGARVRQNNLIRHISAVAPGFTQTTRSLFPTFKKLRELRQSLPENSNVFFNPNRNKPPVKNEQNYPLLSHPAGPSRPASDGPFTSYHSGRQNLSNDLTAFLACWTAYQQTHMQKSKPSHSPFQNGGYFH
jgi:hypothetical protein